MYISWDGRFLRTVCAFMLQLPRRRLPCLRNRIAVAKGAQMGPVPFTMLPSV
jgi:hypothetical protein